LYATHGQTDTQTTLCVTSVATGHHICALRAGDVSKNTNLSLFIVQHLDKLYEPSRYTAQHRYIITTSNSVHSVTQTTARCII